MAIFTGGKSRFESKETFRTEVRTEVEALDFDKYLGTIGVASDAPKNLPANSNIKHYTNFPENAQEGNWLRVVSETTIQAKTLLIGEEWLCVVAKKDKTPAEWVPAQAGSKLPLYPSYSSNVGYLRRDLDLSSPQVVKPNEVYVPAFYAPLTRGVFRAANIDKTQKRYQHLGDLVANSVEFDFYARVEFANEKMGERTMDLYLNVYYPVEDSLYEVNLEIPWVIDSTANNSRAPLFFFRPNMRLPIEAPLDESPLSYVVSLQVKQTSNIPLNLIFGEIVITARG